MSTTLFLLLLSLSFSSAKVCPPCGNTTVPYPLSTSTSCGDQDYKIRCQSDSLFFDGANLNTTYAIKSINPSKLTLVIMPPTFMSPDTCITTDFQYEGLELNENLPFNFTNTNMVMYLNCSQSMLETPLNCTSISPCHKYINGTIEGATCKDTNICCSVQFGGFTTSYQIKTTELGCSAYRSFVDLNQTAPVGQWMEKEGVEIQWASPKEPLCETQEDCNGNSTCMSDVAGGRGALRCLCIDGLVWNPFTGTCVNGYIDCKISGDCRGSNSRALIAGLTVGLGAMIILMVVVFLFYKRKRGMKERQERVARKREEILNINNMSGRKAHHFTSKEIKRATYNFSRDLLLGVGGYGEVFKGRLRDGMPIAVKVAKLGNAKSTNQILNEVSILSQVNHRSLVQLLGFSVELDQPVLVYEFIPNGTLHDHLHGRIDGSQKPLSWRRRLAIAHQTAEGLAYLHFSAVPPIYHRDVKSSNILLDENMDGKVSDFGLSRLAVSDLSHISTCAQGTLGYLDPEYYRNYHLTDKSDVYSFGVVLLELLTSKKAIDFNREEEDVNLVMCVQRCMEEGRMMDVVDPHLVEGATQLEFETIGALAFLAVSCLEERRQNRPSMKEVAEEIDYIINLEAGATRRTCKFKY
ncbi:Protein kinase-related protein [Zostera marina]|uniref:Protein kinase-related protein n=1 Tax=Zostera marina TaxID=29655 RepID=A0A0K9NUI0_ZOSMR|nr:Protein kinase-related protein [Zostera marina]